MIRSARSHDCASYSRPRHAASVRSETRPSDGKDERQAQVDFVIQRFRVDKQEAARSLMKMDIASRTLLAMEMAERECASYTAEYDPFEGL